MRRPYCRFEDAVRWVDEALADAIMGALPTRTPLPSDDRLSPSPA